MRAKFLILFVILLAIGASIMFDRIDKPKQIAPGPVVTFDFQTLDGAHHSTDEFKGKTMLVNFWATWCPPCRTEIPDLIKLAKDHPNMVLVLMSGDQTPDAVQSFVAEAHIHLPNIFVVWDNGLEVTRMFHVTGYPETAVIGPDQRGQYAIVGPLAPKDIAALKQSLAKP